MTSLAVKVGWLPIAETIFTVVDKIQNLNSLNDARTRSIFLKERQYQSCKSRGDYLLPKSSFDFHSITSKTGWNRSVLQLSFTDTFPILCRKLWHDRLRVCSECYSHGVHLIFHQSSHWDRCPIHSTELRDTCLYCQTPLGPYGLRRSNHTLGCMKCGYNPFLTPEYWIDDRIEQTKPFLLASYVKWISNIDNYFSRSESNHNRSRNKYLWISSPDRAVLSSYNHLIPGPTWLSESLTGCKNLKLTNHPITNQNFQRKHRHTIEATNMQFGPPRASLRLDGLKTEYKEVDIDEVKAKIRSNEEILTRLICEAQERIFLVLSQSSRCATKVNDLKGHACIKYDYERFQSRIVALQTPSQFNSFWQDWLHEPGRHFRIKYNEYSDTHKAINVNETATILMTRIWIRAMFLAMAKQHFSAKTDNLQMPIFGLHQNVEKEISFRVVSQKISLRKILENRVCTDR